MTTVNGGISFWYAGTGIPLPREPLPGDAEADVVIVGGGYTGLWTAYYLKQAVPFLRITVLEARFCGYGASGRNGGRLHNRVAGRERYARLHGQDAAVRLQQAMDGAVEEVLRVAEAEEIDAEVRQGGVLDVACSPAQLVRLRAHHAREAAFGAKDGQLLGAAESARRIRAAGAVGASWTPHGARVHPVKLLQGLAAAVERLGVTVHESTAVTEIRPKHAVTPYGTVRAPYVLRCTEGFTASVKGQRRSWLPVISSMIVTEPLPPESWATIGWEGGETLGDLAHAPIYAQRTADGRIALGGRGVPYRFGSRTDDAGRTPERTVAGLREALVRLFPGTAGVAVAHAWSGVLGVPRDGCASVHLDRTTGLGWAGGYGASGLAASNLAARTLRDLVQLDSGQGHGTELTALPWVGHRARRWEPEPLRWAAVHGLHAAYRGADRRELAGRSAATDPLARYADRISGRR
ncbi:NAD(P)/FAD-dependent oxidoreductase [Streptomyces sp. NPDC049040]|uniref:NAD(P)/FAD-dependent oxidoreductase n=1 Tax=Streptomyces sp. NPDC049040 TaxID=3365593 RepID=UPI003710F7B8